MSTLTPTVAPEAQWYSLIFDDEQAYTRYIRLEATRLEAKWAGRSGRPEGLRLSTECPVRRIREFLDPAFRIEFPAGACERGHECESRFLACVPSIIAEYQAVIHWSAGFSAWDGIGHDGEFISLKSAVGKKRPSTANRRQDDRMLVAAGAPPGSHVDTYMVDPANLSAYGAIRHTLSEERHAEVTQELADAHAAVEATATTMPTLDELDDAAYWQDTHRLACNCGACTRHDDTVDADHPLEVLTTRYALAKAGAAASDAQIDEVRAQLIEAATLRLAANPDARTIRTHFDSYTINQNKTGGWVIRPTRNKQEAP